MKNRPAPRPAAIAQTQKFYRRVAGHGMMTLATLGVVFGLGLLAALGRLLLGLLFKVAP